MTRKRVSISRVALGLLLSLAVSGAPLCAQSLWMSAGNTERSMYADPKAARRGDILTVIVSETSNVVTTLRLDTDKDASIQNQVSQWLFSTAASGFGTHNGELPATNITGDNEYSGGGEISNSQTLTATLTVVVIDQLPNGVLVVEGSRAISTSGETIYAVFRGLVRPADISASNQINSDRVADARLEFLNAGALTEAQKKGWLLRFNDRVNPF